MNCELCQAPPGRCECIPAPLVKTAGEYRVYKQGYDEGLQRGKLRSYCRDCEYLRAELATAKREVARLRDALEDERLEYQVMVNRL